MQDPLVGSTSHKKRACAFCKRFHCGAFFVLLAMLFFLLSIILPGVIQDALLSGIYGQVTLSQSVMDQQTLGWKTWADTRDLSSGQYMLAWFYNVTNAPDVLNGSTPILAEVGPYAYTQYTYMQNISFPVSIDGFKLAKFKQWTWFQFNPSMSFAGANPMTDNVTIPNLAMLGLFYQSEILAWGAYHKKPEVNRMYATHTPNEWLFGYFDHDIKQPFPGVSPNQTLEQALDRDFDQIYTGEDDHSLTRQYYTFQSSSVITCAPERVLPNFTKPCWGTTEANRLHGTDGAQFAPTNIVQEGGSVTTWVDDLFRELPLYNTDNETIVVEGITLHKFKVRKEELQCAANNSNTKQYYSYGLDGYWNITAAQGLLPTFISMPHLLYANPLMFDYFENMSQPIKDVHETTLGVELNTGMTLSARKRWQINFGIKPLVFEKLGGITWFENITMPPLNQSEYLYHPAMWMQLQGDVSSEDASTFKSGVYLGQTMLTFFKWGCMAIALVALLLGVFVWYPLLVAAGHKHLRAMEPMA